MEPGSTKMEVLPEVCWNQVFRLLSVLSAVTE